MSGWGSWLSGSSTSGSSTPAPGGANFTPITDVVPQDSLFGKLEPSDLEWTCAGGFTTETQTWYTILKDGSFATSQIIHSAVGLWYPQIQVTFKYYNPTTKEKIWKSVNVTHFAAPPPEGFRGKKWDKRSSKSDQYSALFETLGDGSEKYTIEANMDTDLQLAYSFTRPAGAHGWKLGGGPTGGKSLFGTNTSSPDGYVVHRLWPTAKSTGHFIIKGKAIDAEGQGMFSHAIQGMRPNLVASKWNFANFQSEEEGGVQAIMMEFTTTSDYGSAPVSSGEGGATSTGGAARESMTVNIGSITQGGKLIAVTASTRGSKTPSDHPSKGSSSSVRHLDRVLDNETSYYAPQAIQFNWEGPLLQDSGKGDPHQLVKASTKVDLGRPSPSSEAKGLVDKVDVLAEIPYVVRKVVNYVAGTKPYIYQTLNKVTLNLTTPGQGEKQVKGDLFEEHTFISSVVGDNVGGAAAAK